MTQLELFTQMPSRAPVTASPRDRSRKPPAVTAARANEAATATIEVPAAAVAIEQVGECAGNPAGLLENESEQIVAALHARTHKGFEAATDSFLTNEEREHVRVTHALPGQRALAYDRIVERLTQRWGELNAWPVFARIAEPGTQVKKNMRVCTLDLLGESRGLSGRIAFRVERDLRRVAEPIPVSVLRSLEEHRRGPFVAFAFLEPLYRNHGTRGDRTILRSIAAVRRAYCRPIDPIIVAWLGGGPRNYGLPLFRPKAVGASARRSIARRSSVGELVFLIGHWD
jgi:hypothetical protein